jgi:hypothetical protein
LPKRPVVSPSDVFINVPFDSQHERLFLALIAGLVALGLNPRCVLEVPPSTDRLRRLCSLIRACPFSIHDLSQIQLSPGPFRVPRFNMPFELGLAAAIAFEDGVTHQWRALERVPFRLNQSLSDIGGYDHSIHSGTIEGTMDVLLDIFGNAKSLSLSEVDDLMWVYRRVREFRATLRSSIYRANAFRKIVATARLFAEVRAIEAADAD